MTVTTWCQLGARHTRSWKRLITRLWSQCLWFSGVLAHSDFCENFVKIKADRDLVLARCTPHDILEEIDHPLVVQMCVVLGCISPL